MNCKINFSDINETFIIDSVPLTGGSEVASACTVFYTNMLSSCSGDTHINLETGRVLIDKDLNVLGSISASTFYGDGSNLSGISISDTYVTGGTYNQTTGTATFVNNSGGTFNVSGFLTGSTSSDTYLTGATFSNNTLFLRDNSGGTITTLIDNFSGLTVNGSVSATTFYGDGSNLSGITFMDVFVTGGTYSNGTTVFTNNTGGTFNISGFFTGSTDNNRYITATTFTNNTLILFDNSGATISTLINNFSGLTVNGSVSATTFFGNGSNLTGITDNDRYVTGGTYNQTTGTATFVNNSGGTFNVSGFLTAGTDNNRYITAATFSNNILSLSDNSGTTVSTLINNFSGLTVNGSVSATTFFGNGSNLTGITDNDRYVTGGTYSDTTLTLVNNSGNTISISGITGSTNIYSGNGSINSNRIINIDGFSVNFSGSAYPNTLVMNGGNVGIGKSAPIAKLDINGDINIPTTSSATYGVIKQSGVVIFHSYGTNNIFGGVNSGNFTLTSSQNTTYGTNNLFLLTSGFRNSAFGYLALTNTRTGSDNAAFGNSALHDNNGGSNNSAFGNSALADNINGSNNSAFGYNALRTNTGGTGNVAFGGYALDANTSGSQNVAIGYNSLHPSISGSFNVGVGALSLNSNINGTNNTAVGYSALGATTGNSNVALGRHAGLNETGSNKLHISNTSVYTLIYGDFTNRYVGINTTGTTNTLHVSAATNPVRFEGLAQTFTDNKILTTDSNGEIHYIDSGYVTANTYTTGATFSNNTLVLINNTGGTVSTLLNNFSGLTVNGNISATTISATTFFGNGGNLTGITDNDRYITGSTFTNNILSLTNNSGTSISTLLNNFSGLTVNEGISATTISATTFFGNGSNLTGITGSTDTYTTGATFSNNTLTLRNNTGGTVSTLLNNFSGLTVNGPVLATSISATTISATTFYGNGSNLTGIVDSDRYTTGVTFSNNTLTLRNNSGTSISTLINNFSGLTVNGNISATTISATTFFGNGSNLTGIVDRYITGSTFTNNTLTLRNNTGGTITTLINNFSGLTVNGGISATTISATTYYGNGSNLTGIVDNDRYITGSTFNNNTLSLTNNSGTTISTLLNNFSGLTVNGSISATTISATTLFGNGSNITGIAGGSDTYTTGATFSNNTLTLRNNTGGTISTLINNFSGLTVNGGMSATTISATTFYGNGSNLTGISAGSDTYTTGATFSNNTLLLRNNTGGTISTLIDNFSGLTVNGSVSATTISATTFYGDGSNLTGISAGSDTYTTGATFSNNILTLRNNTGGTISTLIDNFSGLTVNGGISATTISAATYQGVDFDLRAIAGSQVLSADTSTTNTIATSTNLSFPIGANETYDVTITGTAAKSGATSGMKMCIAAPVGATVKGFQTGGAGSVTTAMLNGLVTNNGVLGSTFATGNNVEVPFVLQVSITNSSTSGTCVFQYAAVTNGVAFIFAGTKLRYTKSTLV